MKKSRKLSYRWAQLTPVALAFASALTFAIVGVLMLRLSTAQVAVYAVPGNITRDCSANVSSQLNAWLASIPNNAELRFGGGCFRIDQTLLVINKANWKIDGEGATFRALSPTGDSSTVEIPSTAARSRSQWRLVTGNNIAMTRMVIRGAHPNAGSHAGAYVASVEGQHGIHVQGATNVDIGNVEIYDVYADFVYFGSGGNSLWSSGRVHHSRMERNGRQGIAVTAGKGIRVDNNYIAHTQRATLDLEPHGGTSEALEITFDSNSIGPGRLLFIAAHGNAEVSDITISNNTLSGKTMGSSVRWHNNERRKNWKFINNTSNVQASGSGGYVVDFRGVDGVEVSGNTQPVDPRDNFAFAYVENSTGVTARGNTMPGGVTPVRSGSGVVLGLVCGNRLSATGAFNVPTTCPTEPPPTPTNPTPPTGNPTTPTLPTGTDVGNLNSEASQSIGVPPAETGVSTDETGESSSPVSIVSNSVVKLSTDITNPELPLWQRVSSGLKMFLIVAIIACVVWGIIRFGLIQLHKHTPLHIAHT